MKIELGEWPKAGNVNVDSAGAGTPSTELAIEARESVAMVVYGGADRYLREGVEVVGIQSNQTLV